MDTSADVDNPPPEAPEDIRDDPTVDNELEPPAVVITQPKPRVLQREADTDILRIGGNLPKYRPDQDKRDSARKDARGRKSNAQLARELQDSLSAKAQAEREQYLNDQKELLKTAATSFVQALLEGLGPALGLLGGGPPVPTPTNSAVPGSSRAPGGSGAPACSTATAAPTGSASNVAPSLGCA